jgi:hypothetical protein
MNSSKITQRNHVIDYLDEEFDDFITAQVESSQGLIANFKKPTGKELTETRKQGKALIQLVKAWCQLKKTMVEYECHVVIGAIKEYTYGTLKYSEKASTLQINKRKTCYKICGLEKEIYLYIFKLEICKSRK